MIEDFSFDNDNKSIFSDSSFANEYKTLFQYPFKNVKFKKYYFICKECSKTPLIDLTKELILIKCQDPKHHNPKIRKIKELKEKEEIFLFEEDNIDLDCMKCENHKEPYFYYCCHKGCRKNVCKQDYNFHSKNHNQDLYGFIS